MRISDWSSDVCSSDLEAAGRRLFARDTHRVALTADGEAMLGFARSILETGERARQYFEGSKIRGRLRFGVPEDFVLSGLPDILREFTRIHPLIDLEQIGRASCRERVCQYG